MAENISQWFAREFLCEKRGRSVSQIMADGTGMSIDGVHLAMILGGAIVYFSLRD